MQNHEQQVERYHRLLPVRLWHYLRGRGIGDSTIKKFRLGWDGQRITIPIYNRYGKFAFFRLAKDPDSKLPTPKMLSTAGTRAELYGWERVNEQPKEIIICEGEFDRLVLESRGFAAVTSTCGVNTFRLKWAEPFKEIPHVYVCFDLDEAGHLGARRVASLIRHARIVRLPDYLGHGGDVTDFFVGLKKTADGFRSLLDRAQPLDEREVILDKLPKLVLNSPASAGYAAQLKAETTVEWIVSRYVKLRKSGRNFIGRCPFHNDHTPSFVVFPATQSFHCFGCKTGGDCISFLMRREGLSFPEAMDALKILNRL